MHHGLLLMHSRAGVCICVYIYNLRFHSPTTGFEQRVIVIDYELHVDVPHYTRDVYWRRLFSLAAVYTSLLNRFD